MKLDINTIKNLIKVARKQEEADLVIKGAMMLDVFCGKLEKKDIAIKDGFIVGIGENYQAKEEINVDRCFVVPGYIDAHIHIESTMLHPVELVKAILPRGTTALVCDPHEIANVLGNEGIKYLLEETEGLPVDFFFTVPSCVPAAKGLETSGAEITAEDIKMWIKHPRIVGLGEVMNYPAVLNMSEEVLEKIMIAIEAGKRIDGHAPQLVGDDLCAYAACGIWSDHECTTLREAEDKLKRGVYIMIREGSTAKNMASLIPLVRAYGVSRFMLVSDDRHPDDLLEEGHLDIVLRKAIYMGLPPNIAVRMVTFNPAFYFGLSRRGAIAPGYIADMVIVNNLREFYPHYVIKNGKIVARDMKLIFEMMPPRRPKASSFNVNLKENEIFKIEAKGKKVRVIGIIPGEILTEEIIEELPIVEGKVLVSPEKDIVKLAVVERHKGTGNVGLGFVKGLGLKKGAIGLSVAHDSHNIIIAGTNDADMEEVLHEIIRLQGGIAIAAEGKVIESLPLPIAGLMSDLPINKVVDKLKQLKVIARYLGSSLENPFMTLSFLALPVIPKLKLTDKGLFNVDKFSFVDLFVD
ncbi:MAG: adenine deaminase [Thermosulfidibacteraceae bacterium]|jgi:adenine deaminase